MYNIELYDVFFFTYIVNMIVIQLTLSKVNLCRTSFYVHNRQVLQVKLKIPYIIII